VADAAGIGAEPSSAGIELADRQTRQWLERLVIGQNLCPFARVPYEAGTVRFRISRAEHPEDLASDLLGELQHLVAQPRDAVETTLFVYPWVLREFAQFNAFLDVADACLEQLELVGQIQLASFHPDYQFADTSPADVSNATNRSPHPMLHLIREVSICEALDRYAGDPAEIPRRNVELLEELDWAGVAAVIAGDSDLDP